MDKLLIFTQELKKPNILNISVINELNLYVCDKFEKLFQLYAITKNKFFILQELVKFGILLENTLTNKIDFVSMQLSTLSNLIIPIILRIKEVCFELNNQIIDDFKSYYNLIIDNEPKYQEKLKIFKSIQIFSYIKIYYNSKPTEIPFDDFGISIKIPNPNDKYLFKDIIEFNQIFLVSDKILAKKIDWIWKANNSDINNKSNYMIYETDMSTEIIINKSLKKIDENLLENNVNKNISSNFINFLDKKIIIEDESVSLSIQENENENGNGNDNELINEFEQNNNNKIILEESNNSNENNITKCNSEY